jgi:hypothetical protein
MAPMTTNGVRYGDLGALRRALAEAERTDESNAKQAIARFVELRPGVQDVLQSKRHHLLTGRRGTGKSTLLTVVRHSLRKEGAPVAVIDMEKFKGRPFPDVLIEILIRLLDEVRPTIRRSSPLRDLRLQRQFNRSRKQLVQLLNDPQAMTKAITRSRKSSRGRAIGVRGGVKAPATLADLSGGASADASRSSSDEQTARAQYEELKIERLQQLASRLSDELVQLVAGSAKDQAVIFIDDFYYVHLSDQPDVLDYLKQVVKSTGIWLKIGGVGARMRPYREGDPPIGMQPDQDMNTLSLDVTLNDFGTAKRFLEEMVDGVLKPVGLTVTRLMTDTARNRMVLACGGAVARDYLVLTSAALDAAIERLSKQAAPTDQTAVRVEAEDVNLAARQRMNKKEDTDLALDAGPDAGKLRERWRDICEFAQSQGNTAFVLVRQEDIDKAAWGDEVAQLENLRLLHRIKDAVPNTSKWRGVKCIVFMVDLGQVAHQRLTAGIPEFWRGTLEFDKLRRAEWVYGPDWKSKLAERQAAAKRHQAAVSDTGGKSKATASELDDDVLTLFDDPSDLDQTG